MILQPCAYGISAHALDPHLIMSGHNSSPRKLHLTRAASAALRLSASHSSRLASSDLNAASNVVDGDTSILETSTNSPTPQSAVAHSAIDIGPRTGSSHTTLEGISHHDVVAEEQLSLTELAERLPARPTKEQKDLINMPRVREITLRLGRVARLNSSRPERLIALLGQTRGEIAAPACETCASKRSGLFTSCVIIPGMFQGQCCNCRYVGRGRCSFRHRTSPDLCKTVTNALQSHRFRRSCEYRHRQRFTQQWSGPIRIHLPALRENFQHTLPK